MLSWRLWCWLSGCFDCDWWRSGSTAAAGWKKAQQARRRSWCSVPAACTNCSNGAVIIHGVPKRMVAWGLNMWHPVDCMRFAHRPAGPIDPDLWPHDIWKWNEMDRSEFILNSKRPARSTYIYIYMCVCVFFLCIILAIIISWFSWTCLAYQSPSPQKKTSNTRCPGRSQRNGRSRSGRLCSGPFGQELKRVMGSGKLSWSSWKTNYNIRNMVKPIIY